MKAWTEPRLLSEIMRQRRIESARQKLLSIELDALAHRRLAVNDVLLRLRIGGHGLNTHRDGGERKARRRPAARGRRQGFHCSSWSRDQINVHGANRNGVLSWLFCSYQTKQYMRIFLKYFSNSQISADRTSIHQ